ncbi:MAG: hypothetical protein Ta2G_05850 [Termitinemataceae bacterium]|nr:MAG: hypothetical protein Ta2G_05850 [Termitinemataceae bacterium]
MDTNNKRKIDAYKKTIDQKPTPLDKEHSKLEENAFVKDLSFSEKALSFAKLPHKTQGEAAGEAAAEADGGKDSKYRRVAKFLILLGSEQASSVLENLGEEQVEKISAEIVTIRYRV